MPSIYASPARSTSSRHSVESNQTNQSHHTTQSNQSGSYAAQPSWEMEPMGHSLEGSLGSAPECDLEIADRTISDLEWGGGVVRDFFY